MLLPNFNAYFLNTRIRVSFSYLLILFICTLTYSLNSQGCVAIRGFSGCSGNIGAGSNLNKGEFLIGIDFRNFKSFRHFRGNHEETHRLEMGTEVINRSNFIDITINYGISDRLFANIILPFATHHRSSMYEHGGNPPNGLGSRNITTSSGLSDMRLGLGFWLFDPLKEKKYNYAIGLGIKLPTGDYNYQDNFYNQGPERNQTIKTVVDQSIQLGDGGFGIALDFQGYHQISSNLLMTTNVFYLINPKETNGILIRNGQNEFSVPDQYAIRSGFFYMTGFKGLAPFLGARWEGVPAHDLAGGSGGYRRPGYAISVEPGLSYSHKNFTLIVNVPIAVVRNRTQSFLDKQRTEMTGVYTHGDAAFADFLTNINLSYRFGKNHNLMDAKKSNDPFNLNP